MKRPLIFFVIVTGIFFLVLATLAIQRNQKKSAMGAQEGITPAAGKIVYAFKDDKDKQRFQQFMQVRQIVDIRIAVLQSYLDLEMGNLQQVDGQFSLLYKLDSAKSYMLDPQSGTIREVTPPPAPTQSQTTAAPPAQP